MGLATDAELKKLETKIVDALNVDRKWILSANKAFKSYSEHIGALYADRDMLLKRVTALESEIYNLKKTDQEMKAVISALKALPTPEATTSVT